MTTFLATRMESQYVASTSTSHKSSGRPSLRRPTRRSILVAESAAPQEADEPKLTPQEAAKLAAQKINEQLKANMGAQQLHVDNSDPLTCTVVELSLIHI